MSQMSSTKQNIITLHSASTSLGIKQTQLNEILVKESFAKVKNSKGKWAITVEDFKKVKEIVVNTISKKVNPEVEEQKYKLGVLDIKTSLIENVTVNLRERTVAPDKTILFVGPTNSGKTYHALEELFRDYEAAPTERHVYCGPLRLLAYEVYLKMVDRYGEENVGFITGEEQINPTANLLATTAEMAPMAGHSIIIDEAHWLVDEDRGHIWTRLLYSSEYNNIYVVTAGEAVELIQTLTNQSWYSEARVFERKTAIQFGGSLSIKSLPPKTAVVCFSRKNVYAVASAIHKSGVSVGVLYGALPLPVRRKQIEDYLAGKYDVMVVTDVIGHGINLPIDNVVFTETEKFDGKESRDLYVWEGAQISGRAGRFGLSEQGNVYLAEGLPWFEQDSSLVKEFVKAAGGKISTDLEALGAFFAPKFKDLGLPDTHDAYTASLLAPAVYQWQRKFDLQTPEIFAESAPLTTEQKNLMRILNTINVPFMPWNEHKILGADQFPTVNVNPHELWQLASGPYTENLPTIEAISRWLISPYREDSPLLKNFYDEEVLPAVEATSKPYNSLEEHMILLEKTLQVTAELKMAFIMFGEQSPNDATYTLGSLNMEIVLEAEKVLTAAIIRKLNLNVKQSNAGVCSTCYKPISPNKSSCDNCWKN